ncbi:hypothetical protein B7R54_04940 [Subtercola boreus]|uniref:DUF2809 domain-containing protein n=1 Tax=Subtercola boreus TaxID=120213 RepID=A0A3E0VGT1_9MICO|nr:DUF2809 domain-containing protein [Subtercola boreus]RFA08648.1 hypothetical protein B7R54_04940 [Subtercola boreus]TQL54409.1 uncharacterized protein DUF2809 [Subtercola boreus]
MDRPPATPDPGSSRPVRRRRRLALAVAALLTIGVGLGVHFGASGAAADFAGDALYAVLVYLVVAAIAPRLRSVRVGAIAFGLCAAVECFQLTGVPQSISAGFPAAALLLGSTFSPVDLLAYAAGIVVITALDASALTVRRSRHT